MFSSDVILTCGLYLAVTSASNSRSMNALTRLARTQDFGTYTIRKHMTGRPSGAGGGVGLRT